MICLTISFVCFQVGEHEIECQPGFRWAVLKRFHADVFFSGCFSFIFIGVDLKVIFKTLLG